MEVIELDTKTKDSKKLGRPTTPDYRKRLMRFARVEDSFKDILHLLGDTEQKVVLETLERLKA